MAVPLRHKSLRISLPFTAQQQRVMAICKVCLFWRTRATAAFSILLYFHLELNASVTHLTRTSSETKRSIEQI